MEASPTRDLAHDGNPTRFIPFELTFEILSRLPAKPLIRFQSVSKLWFSIIRSKDFADSFLIRSKTRPRLLFSFQHFDSRQRFIFSAPEHHNNNNDEEEEKSSSTVIARHDMTISDLVYDINTRPVNGLVCCTRKLDSSSSSIAVCNPTTRQILKLPDQEHFVFTLGSQQQEWRKVEIVQGDPYTSFKGGICINGAIYYVVLHKKIARFDVRSEKMEFIKAPEDEEDLEINAFCWTLINHKGRLGGINYRYFYHMRAWIQEEEESWNNMTGVVTSEWGDLLREISLYSTGEIHTGEVLLVPYRLESSKPFSVFYYDMIRESFRSGQVLGIADYEFRRRFHGFGKRNRGMRCFPGHIENIMFF
ncbi:hypothetical protein EUTSA_v10015900mg [Eutrema salsugineum]|uniref:F-box domain-containing protein n=1 Tax=Eutrema salsugineum TaxID=72664 RepID=V4KW68_EUTSA|nr:hypothetical protein EUTSA_v10015900mg [Eutrema salsugineum]